MKKLILAAALMAASTAQAKTNLVFFGNSMLASFPKITDCNYLSETFMGIAVPGKADCDGVTRTVREQLNKVGIDVYDSSVPSLSAYDAVHGKKERPSNSDSFIPYDGGEHVVWFPRWNPGDKNILLVNHLENDILRKHSGERCFSESEIVQNHRVLINAAISLNYHKVYWLKNRPGWGDSAAKQTAIDPTWCKRTGADFDSILGAVSKMMAVEFPNVSVIDVSLDGFDEQSTVSDSLHWTTLGQFRVAAKIIEGLRYDLN